MNLQERFFGKGVPALGGPVVANSRLNDPPSFEILFSGPLNLDAETTSLALRDFHPELTDASVELLTLPPPPTSTANFATTSPTQIGLIGWGRHVIKLVAFAGPLAEARVKACVQPAHYHADLKEAAYHHGAHATLYYAGYELDPLEQHVALAVVAGVLAHCGAIVVINETAQISIPAMTLLPHEEDEGDTLRALRSLPLPIIYAGFVMMEIEGEPGVWMRTYGCHAFRLPDFALRAEAHHQAPSILELFSNMLNYLRSTTKTFVPGDRMGIEAGQLFHFRTRTAEEWFLESLGEMLVLEQLDPDEVTP